MAPVAKYERVFLLCLELGNSVVMLLGASGELRRMLLLQCGQLLITLVLQLRNRRVMRLTPRRQLGRMLLSQFSDYFFMLLAARGEFGRMRFF